MARISQVWRSYILLQIMIYMDKCITKKISVHAITWHIKILVIIWICIVAMSCDNAFLNTKFEKKIYVYHKDINKEY